MAAALITTSASYITSTKHELEESQLTDRITDVLSAGVNVVAAITPTKANSADSQMSASRLDGEIGNSFYCVASHRPYGIFVAETIQDHNRRASPAGIIDALAAKLLSVRNPAACQRNRKTRVSPKYPRWQIV